MNKKTKKSRNETLENPSPAPFRRQTRAMAAAAAMAALVSLAAAGDLRGGQSLHGAILRRRPPLPLPHANALIHLYSRCSRPDLSLRLFLSLPFPNLVSFSSLMAAHLRRGDPSAALLLLPRLLSLPHLRPNEFILSAALSAAAAAPSPPAGLLCHSLLLKSGLSAFPVPANALLCFYLSCSGLSAAARALPNPSPSSPPNLFACNSLIAAYSAAGRPAAAAPLLSLILPYVHAWDRVTFLVVLGLCARAPFPRLGAQARAQALRRGLDRDVFVGNAVVDLLGKSGDAAAARVALRCLPVRNVVSWSSAMAAMVQNELPEEAFRLWREMEDDAVAPNEVTFAMALGACGSLAALRQGEAFAARALRGGLWARPLVQNAAIVMLSRAGAVKDAKKVFEGMPDRDVVSWNAIISGLAQHGLAAEALRTFEAMPETPTAATFAGVLTACAALSRTELGLGYLGRMRGEFGVEPGVEHYTCVVGMLCRAGRAAEAGELMRNAPVEWDGVAWRTLLGGCVAQGGESLGAAAERVADDAGAMVMLSNMHAGAGEWGGVAAVRGGMRRRGLKKEPGISWLQLGGRTHVFAAGNRGDPRCREVYAILVGAIRDLARDDGGSGPDEIG
ncbi:pentatricopeptide repeat-containing protein At5g39680-like [Wolffia australiana]